MTSSFLKVRRHRQHSHQQPDSAASHSAAVAGGGPNAGLPDLLLQLLVRDHTTGEAGRTPRAQSLRLQGPLGLGLSPKPAFLQGYYRRTAEYFPTKNRQRQGCFQVPMVHSTFLVSLQTEETAQLAFYPPHPNYTWPFDDIIVFAYACQAAGEDRASSSIACRPPGFCTCWVPLLSMPFSTPHFILSSPVASLGPSLSFVSCLAEETGSGCSHLGSFSDRFTGQVFMEHALVTCVTGLGDRGSQD